MPVKLEMRNYFLAYLDRRAPSLVLRLLEFCMLVFAAFCTLAFDQTGIPCIKLALGKGHFSHTTSHAMSRSRSNYVLLECTTDTVPMVQPLVEPGADCEDWHSAVL